MDDADLEAHCSPLGKSTHREPVINTQKIVLQTFRQGVCGFPFGRFEGSAGNRGSRISHWVSVSPSNLPAIFSSSDNRKKTF